MERQILVAQLKSWADAALILSFILLMRYLYFPQLTLQDVSPIYWIKLEA
jgi:hypothetical protein